MRIFTFGELAKPVPHVILRELVPACPDVIFRECFLSGIRSVVQIVNRKQDQTFKQQGILL
jgi:hypothetical protein